MTRDGTHLLDTKEPTLCAVLTSTQALLWAIVSLRAAVLVFAALTLIPLPGRAVQLDRETSFEIPAQPLPSALIRFSQQANLQIVTSGRKIVNASSPGVVGRVSVAEALQSLLKDTGFTYQTIGDLTISVVSASDEEDVRANHIALVGTGIGPFPGVNGAGRRANFVATTAPSEVVVTGTRVSDRTIAESLSPIDVVLESTLRASGTPEVNQQLSRLLPSFNFPRPSITDGTDHIRPAQLRGLSPDQTLVLINGKRRHTTALVNVNGSIGRGSAPVDMNALPMSAVQRIEVLRDGASAQYGSDAIAGVINLILKEETSGGSVDVRYGEYGEGDGALTQGAAWLGLPLATEGFLTLSAEYRNRDATNRARPDPRQMFAPLPDGQPDPREATFDRNVFEYGEPAMDDRILFANGGVPLPNDAELYFFGNYSNRKGESPGYFRRPGESRNVPAIYPDGFLPFITSEVDDTGVVVGTRGITGEWQWDASLNYGANSFRFGVENSLNTMLGATSPTSFYDGTLENSQAVANVDVVRSIENDWTAGSLNLALGAEYRNETYEIHAGERSSYFGTGSQVFPGFRPEDEGDASRHSVAAYAEVDTRFTDKFSGSAAARFEDYSDFGSATSAKLSGRYAVLRSLALRSTVSTGFRAPSLAQQNYSTTATVFPANGDPASDIHTFRVSDPVAIALGAEPLRKERSHNYSVGIVSQPMPDLYFTLDLYRIHIDDRIVLSENFLGPDVQAFLASRGFRDTDGGRYFTNAVDTTTRGVDLTGRFTNTFDNGSKLILSLAYNRNKTALGRIAPDPPVLVEQGFDFERVGRQERGRITVGSPRDKLVLGTDYAVGSLEMQVNATRYGEWTDVALDPKFAQVFGAEVVVDVAASYRLQQRMFITVGADNVTGAYPDEFYTGNNFGGILPYSPMSPFGFSGAFYYLKLRYDFKT
jgi:iron complex outermembrane recepter protein